MCGICGWYNLNTEKHFTEEQLLTMRDALQHRGPDEAGSYYSPECALGHRRLSIIGLSDGQQPIWNEDKTVVVVFNGEIYNYEALRDELKAQGHQFSTHSDTEVLVHLWEQHGPHFVHKLRGMFAFVIYDLKQETIFGARDRFGQKPFFYRWKSQQFLFASEIKSLLTHPVVSDELDPVALDQFLFYQFVPQPRTMFADIQQLPAAHTFLIHEGNLTLNRYWQTEYQPAITRTAREEEEILEHLESQIQDAVRSHLISDVPVGLFLSGGLDSSYLAACCSEIMEQPLSSFSISFPNTKYDEQEYAKTVSQKFKLKHRTFDFEPGDLKTYLPKAIGFFDQPLADSAALPLMMLSEKTAEFVKVVLTGDGGDELFAGYQKHMRAGSASTLIQWLSHIYPQYFETQHLARCGSDTLGLRKLGTKLAKWGLPEHACSYFKNYWEGWQRAELYTDSFRESLPNSFESIDLRANDLTQPKDILNQMLQIDCGQYLAGDLLLKTDYATMSASIEARAPFLDHQLAETAAKLPIHMKATAGETKVALRRLGARVLPEDINKRPKRGFGVPVKQWFAGELAPWLQQNLIDAAVAIPKYFNSHVVARYLQEHRSGKKNHASRLYSLLTLELWYRQYVK